MGVRSVPELPRERHDPLMPTATCPRCGGRSARAVAPGYMECESQVLYNVIPAGAKATRATCRCTAPVDIATRSAPTGPPDLPVTAACSPLARAATAVAPSAATTCTAPPTGMCCAPRTRRFAAKRRPTPSRPGWRPRVRRQCASLRRGSNPGGGRGSPGRSNLMPALKTWRRAALARFS